MDASNINSSVILHTWKLYYAKEKNKKKKKTMTQTSLAKPKRSISPEENGCLVAVTFSSLLRCSSIFGWSSMGIPLSVVEWWSRSPMISNKLLLISSAASKKPLIPVKKCRSMSSRSLRSPGKFRGFSSNWFGREDPRTIWSVRSSSVCSVVDWTTSEGLNQIQNIGRIGLVII